MWYNGYMEIGDWITLVAVLVALGIGVASILHTRSMQKRERRERLLNEIIEWGESIRKSSFVFNLAELISVLQLTGDNKRRVLALKIDYECRIVGARYTYLKNIASELDVSVQSAIEDVSANLAKHIQLLGLEFDGKTKENDVPDSIDRLKESVIKMIEVAAGLLPK